MSLPEPGMVIEHSRTALVITDLQNDFLSPGGGGWGLLKESLARNNTIENLEALLRAARDGAYTVAISPHYYYPSDRRWVAPGGALEALMGQLGVFARKGPLTLDGFVDSGADWPSCSLTHDLRGRVLAAQPSSGNRNAARPAQDAQRAPRRSRG